jgi:putative AdoMet-dependent methyltransferase
LTDEEKINFIELLSNMLTNTGKILLGDVSFETKDKLERCKEKYNKDWDNDEFYFIAEEIEKLLDDKYSCSYIKISQCAGVLSITNN